MRRKTVPAVRICGGDLRPGPRGTECPNPVHDWPLPPGYVDASDVADRRLRHGWSNSRCPSCGEYGWQQGRPCGDESDRRRPLPEYAGDQS